MITAQGKELLAKNKPYWCTMAPEAKTCGECGKCPGYWEDYQIKARLRELQKQAAHNLPQDILLAEMRRRFPPAQFHCDDCDRDIEVPDDLILAVDLTEANK